MLTSFTAAFAVHSMANGRPGKACRVHSEHFLKSGVHLLDISTTCTIVENYDTHRDLTTILFQRSTSHDHVEIPQAHPVELTFQVCGYSCAITLRVDGVHLVLDRSTFFLVPSNFRSPFHVLSSWSSALPASCSLEVVGAEAESQIMIIAWHRC